MTTRQYKQFKGLKTESLRDNMTNLELVLNNAGRGYHDRDIQRKEAPHDCRKSECGLRGWFFSIVTEVADASKSVCLTTFQPAKLGESVILRKDITARWLVVGAVWVV